MMEVAFPYRISGEYTPDYCKTPHAMQEFIAQHLKDSKRVVFEGVEVRLVRGPSKSIAFVMNDTQDRLLYANELHKMTARLSAKLPTVLNRRINFQASVWRSSALGYKHLKFAANFFNQLLISRTRNVVSDSQQSQAGETFWQHRVREVLQDPNKVVYGLDCEAIGNTLEIVTAKQILRSEEMSDYYTSGEDYDGFYKRLAICLK